MSDGSMSQEEIDRLLNEVEPPLGHKQEDLITSFEKTTAGIPVYQDRSKIIILTPSMTLREYYAGQALMGFKHSSDWIVPDEGAEHMAKMAFKIADAMIAEGKRQ